MKVQQRNEISFFGRRQFTVALVAAEMLLSLPSAMGVPPADITAKSLSTKFAGGGQSTVGSPSSRVAKFDSVQMPFCKSIPLDRQQSCSDQYSVYLEPLNSDFPFPNVFPPPETAYFVGRARLYCNSPAPGIHDAELCSTSASIPERTFLEKEEYEVCKTSRIERISGGRAGDGWFIDKKSSPSTLGFRVYLWANSKSAPTEGGQEIDVEWEVTITPKKNHEQFKNQLGCTFPTPEKNGACLVESNKHFCADN